LLAIDTVYYTGYLQRASVYLIKALAICSIFQGITGLNIVLPVTGLSNIASVLPESNKVEDTKISGTRKPEEINTELASRLRSRLVKKEVERAEGLKRHLPKKKIKWEYPIGSSPLSKDNLKYDDLDSEQKKKAYEMGNKEKPKYEEPKPIDKTVKRTKSGAEVTLPGETEKKSKRVKKWVNKHIAHLKLEKRGGSALALKEEKVVESSEILKKRVKDPTCGSQKILEDAKIKAFYFRKASASNDEIDREAVLKRIKVDLVDPVSKCWSMLKAGKLDLDIYERSQLLSDLDKISQEGDLTDDKSAMRERINRKVKGRVESEVTRTRIKRGSTKYPKKSNSSFTFSAI